jgi:hypothetical protein
LYASTDVIRVVKSRRIIWTVHVTRMGAMRNAYQIWSENLNGRDHSEDLRVNRRIINRMGRSGMVSSGSGLGTGGSFLGVTRPGREADNSPPYRAEVRMRGATFPLLPYAFVVRCLIKQRLS